MKNPLYLLLPAVLLTALALSSAKKAALPDVVANHPERGSFTALKGDKYKPVALFNGRDMDGWYTFHRNHGKEEGRGKFISIEDGIIRLQGEEFGYFCTGESYKNYYLRVVFRWGEEKYAPRMTERRDSGILYHFAGEDKIWPRSVECQIMEEDCGDYFFVSGTTGVSPNRPAGADLKSRVVRTANYENPGQEWNTIEVICLDDSSWHYTNGHLVNRASELSVSEGKILFQLEGAEIYYKSIELLPLK
jgi:hypothetical protein